MKHAGSVLPGEVEVLAETGLRIHRHVKTIGLVVFPFHCALIGLQYPVRLVAGGKTDGLFGSSVACFESIFKLKDKESGHDAIHVAPFRIPAVGIDAPDVGAADKAQHIEMVDRHFKHQKAGLLFAPVFALPGCFGGVLLVGDSVTENNVCPGRVADPRIAEGGFHLPELGTETVVLADKGSLHASLHELEKVFCLLQIVGKRFFDENVFACLYCFKKTIPAVAPEIVAADTDIIRNAPPELVKSGVGDIMAKYTALADWKIANVLTGEYFCPRIHDMMREAADIAMDSIDGLLQGEADAYAKVTYALVMSGVAMQMMGNSRPASGAEHHISHLIEMSPAGLTVTAPALHGEKAGVGSVLTAREYKRLAEMENIAPCLSEYAPVSPKKIEAFFGGDLAAAILTENKDDCLAAVQPEALTGRWTGIRQIISEIPDPDFLYGLLEELDAKREPEDMGVSGKDMEMIFEYSPLVRNRLTLMRMRRLMNRFIN